MAVKLGVAHLSMPELEHHGHGETTAVKAAGNATLLAHLGILQCESGTE